MLVTFLCGCVAPTIQKDVEYIAPKGVFMDDDFIFDRAYLKQNETLVLFMHGLMWELNLRPLLKQQKHVEQPLRSTSQNTIKWSKGKKYEGDYSEFSDFIEVSLDSTSYSVGGGGNSIYAFRHSGRAEAKPPHKATIFEGSYLFQDGISTRGYILVAEGGFANGQELCFFYLRPHYRVRYRPGLTIFGYDDPFN